MYCILISGSLSLDDIDAITNLKCTIVVMSLEILSYLLAIHLRGSPVRNSLLHRSVSTTTTNQSTTRLSSAMSDPPHITVLYFAAASTAAGRTSERIALPDGKPMSLTTLGTLLKERYATGGMENALDGSQWSVDAEMVDDPESTMLRGGEEVGVICPVSGG